MSSTAKVLQDMREEFDKLNQVDFWHSRYLLLIDIKQKAAFLIGDGL